MLRALVTPSVRPSACGDRYFYDREIVKYYKLLPRGKLMDSQKQAISDQLETRVRVDGTYGADPESLQDYPPVLDNLPPAEKECMRGGALEANLRVIVARVGLDGQPRNYRVEDYWVPDEDDILREADKTHLAKYTTLLDSTTYSLEDLAELEREGD